MPRPPAPPVGMTKSRPVIANIWMAVFHLPRLPTCTCALLPACAIHSLRADTAISLQMVMAEATATPPPIVLYPADRNTRAVATMSLSATGSRNAPKLDEIFHLLARYPSTRSVRDATAKITAAITLRQGYVDMRKTTIRGIMNTLAIVKMFGRFHRCVSFAHFHISRLSLFCLLSSAPCNDVETSFLLLFTLRLCLDRI
mmetsp:Transcript_19528/g.44656  ORF Transcript_19528/g.44656 Transcript_19528/m.44656 type:complete len:200 (-) Transcript_19528:269-868(-)